MPVGNSPILNRPTRIRPNRYRLNGVYSAVHCHSEKRCTSSLAVLISRLVHHRDIPVTMSLFLGKNRLQVYQPALGKSLLQKRHQSTGIPAATSLRQEGPGKGLVSHSHC